jgi:arginine utilization protein RocB
VKDGRLWGRGASDMKGGVAAFVVAALEHAARVSEGTPEVVLYITAGEETGSEGACGATPASFAQNEKAARNDPSGPSGEKESETA